MPNPCIGPLVRMYLFVVKGPRFAGVTRSKGIIGISPGVGVFAADFAELSGNRVCGSAQKRVILAQMLPQQSSYV